MTPEDRRVPASTGPVNLETEEGRAFFQERLATLAKVALFISFGFFVLSNLVSLPFTPSPVLTDARSHRWNLFQLGANAVLAAVWLSCRKGSLPRRTLEALDAGGTFLVCAAAALPVLFWSRELPTKEYAMLLAATNVLFARAAFLPSSPRRTLRIGLACVAPALVAAVSSRTVDPRVFVPGILPFPIGAALWCLCSVAVSTVTSSVIYGLRRKVRDAIRLGQYTLEEKLGEGGMGVVYRARHAMLRRPTAVKLLALGKTAARDIERFEREVQLTALLSHPNTVSIFDYGRTPDGVFYYVMEYLEGINLEVLVSEFGPQPPARVVHVVKQIAGALGEAHAMGLIHRDVKPANIILCERGGAPDVAKIVDFGVVKDVGRAEKPSITGADAITGTPLYLAPETLTADGSVDPRSDIYALGAVAYFLLTGTTVFAGGSVFEICSRHLHTAPDPPSARLGRALPRGLEAVVMSCLEKDPGRRPQTAPELSDLLSDSDDVAPWGEGQAHAWWLEHGARVRGLRARARSEPLDLDTPIRLDVDVEEHLRAADRGTRS